MSHASLCRFLFDMLTPEYLYYKYKCVRSNFSPYFCSICFDGPPQAPSVYCGDAILTNGVCRMECAARSLNDECPHFLFASRAEWSICTSDMNILFRVDVQRDPFNDVPMAYSPLHAPPASDRRTTNASWVAAACSRVWCSAAAAGATVTDPVASTIDTRPSWMPPAMDAARLDRASGFVWMFCLVAPVRLRHSWLPSGKCLRHGRYLQEHVCLIF